MGIFREISPTSFSKLASLLASVANFARVAGAFFQYALANTPPPAGEDDLVNIALRLKHLHAR